VVAVGAAELLEGIRRHHLRVVELAHTAGVHHDDVAQVGAPVTDGEGLVELLLVLGDEHDGAAVAEQVLDLGRRARRVHADGDRADALRAEVGVEPLRTVVGEDRDPITSPHAELDEGDTDARRPLGVLAPGHLLPATEALVAQGDAARCVRRPREQAPGQRRGHAGTSLQDASWASAADGCPR